KYDEASPFPVRRGLGLGISQTGRFLRHFLYQGFNTDEAGRTVFDGLFVHTAGAGRGSFNHRFAQPSRDAHRLSAFFYPTDLYPFSGRGQRDSETGVTDGVLVHESHLPNVMFTNTGYEYWGRAASLIHTTPNADGDVERLPAPAIPGVRWPRIAHEAYRVDYGPRWREGIITVEPPRLGKAFPVRVPQVDADGNEVAGVRGVELLAPLATYAPWSLRGGIVNADELVDFYGTLIPFPRDRAERERTGDPRPSLVERYGDRKRYLELVTRHAETQ